jgi:hypothetical protein
MMPDDVRDRVTSYIQHQGTKSREALIDLVRTSQGRYAGAVSGAGEELSARKPAPEEWSLRELTRHVITTEDFVSDLIAAVARGQQPPERRGGLGMMREDDGRPYSALLDDLQAVNAKMLETIGALPEQPDVSIKPAHPFFGPLNCLEWAAFQRVHDEDHVQHAGKILAALSGAGEPKT